MAMQVGVQDYRPTMDPQDFLRCLGLQVSDQRLVALRSTRGGRSVLHYVADYLFRTSCFQRELRQQWADFGVELLKNGADAFSLAVSNLFWLFEGLRTPFMECAGIDSDWSSIRVADSTLENIRLWTGMVRRAGINLHQYGATEARVWGSLREKQPISQDSRYPVVTQLVYGSMPADWNLVIQDCPINCLVFELQYPPGSFPRDHHLPTKICWEPEDREKQEGPWKLIRILSIYSPEATLEDAISIEQQKREVGYEPFVEIADDTQDDAGVTALMISRASRPRSSASRSHSQPSPLSRRKHANTYQRLSPALPFYHLCHRDHRWHYKWDCDRSQAIRNGSFTAQKSLRWKHGSFLAEISACQDGREPWGSGVEHHTGSGDCPWNCATVKLDKLQVPPDLKPYHPMVAPIVF